MSLKKINLKKFDTNMLIFILKKIPKYVIKNIYFSRIQ